MWQFEQLYFRGDEFFSNLLAAVRQAQQSIEVEAYIFAVDPLGREVAEAFAAAAARGVRVRVIVDGIGSPDWSEAYGASMRAAGVEYKVFHQSPWEWFFRGAVPGTRRLGILGLIRKINSRNHRKLFLIDDRDAFLGGMNVWDVTLHAVHGERAWRDTAVQVRGEGVTALIESFEVHWTQGTRRVRRIIRKLISRKERRKERVAALARESRDDVLINTLRRFRRRNYRLLLARISAAKERIWITSSYFIPPSRLLAALRRAAKRGVSVKLLVPARSDLLFMSWATGALYPALLASGVQIYEYRPTVLHAKSLLIDDYAIVGSSNLNHRSIFHDIEADVVLRKESSVEALNSQFAEDLNVSTQVAIEHHQTRPLWERMIGRALLLIRWFL
jgi:cardiolipin synthase